MDRSPARGPGFGPTGKAPFELEQIHDLASGGLMSPDLAAGAEAVRWHDLSARTGRNDKPAILITAIASGVLTDPREVRVGLEDAWTTCEWPGRAADYELWMMVFELAGSDEDYLRETELRPRSELPETLTLYRAATEGHELGLSWTTSFERAHWFATRIGAIAGGHHRIFGVEAPRDWVLANFHETRGESEFVLDTSPLTLDSLEEILPEEWEYLLAGGGESSQG